MAGLFRRRGRDSKSSEWVASEAVSREPGQAEAVPSEPGLTESRAARAEHPARLNGEETEGERHLREMLDRIAKTEERAAAAERRTRQAMDRLAASDSDQQQPEPPSPPSPSTTPVRAPEGRRRPSASG
jgi:hypothetical protein